MNQYRKRVSHGPVLMSHSLQPEIFQFLTTYVKLKRVGIGEVEREEEGRGALFNFSWASLPRLWL